MSAHRSSRQRNGKKTEGEKYSRADEALWDDAYLLKLFNEQLDNPDAVKDNRDSDSESAASSVAEDLEEEEEEESRSASAATASSATSDAVAAVKANAAAPAPLPVSKGGFPALTGLPVELQGLVQSFYNAGFEAGRYVGRAEADAASSSRKRQR